MNYSYRQQAPAPVMSNPVIDQEYDYGPSSSFHSSAYNGSPAAAAAKNTSKQAATSPTVDGDEALLDLAQLEELHREAEKMKALGNKHMATQEYTRAYNAYSAALQLSPVGPSSHVFLSNRAAALLSLKRYNAAATDARRAIALAPTFGKAHARLGQALYFLKDYQGAVAAYEDAIAFEPDNKVTLTYLEKAKVKLDKQKRRMSGEETSIATSAADSHNNYVPSVATTDPQAHGMGGNGYRNVRGNHALAAAAARRLVSPTASQAGVPPQQQQYSSAKTSPSNFATGGPPMNLVHGMPIGNGGGSNGYRNNNNTGSVSLLGSQQRYHDPNADPDFEEALRIQIQANKYLSNKHYKNAVEEYTAALFLVPDDVNLSPELHLGRAHALNGSRRHERARNDCLLAIRLKPSPAAYSTLAKSYFYMRDYKASLQAFQDCISLLPPGESLGMFDRAYYEKAEAAIEEEEASLSNTSPSRGFGGGISVYSNRTVPKLPPPRFVPRDEAIHASPSLPAMPKQWPQQLPKSPTAFRCGAERQVTFLSEGLGIKLNRGSDGMVRVLSVTPSSPGSPLVRRGDIVPGDVVRECAGVDLRRPITNIMWGDTVALVKMASRPITFVVAKELSEVPPVVQEELKRASAANSPTNKSLTPQRPSNASGDEAVRKMDDKFSSEAMSNDPLVGENQLHESSTIETVVSTGSTGVELSPENRSNEESLITLSDDVSSSVPTSERVESTNKARQETCDVAERTNHSNDALITYASQAAVPTDLLASESLQMRGLEDRLIGGEILFIAPPSNFGWDNLRWLSYSGIRKVAFAQLGYRYFEKARKQLLWSTETSSYQKRLLAIYDEPSLILILRRPDNETELVDVLGLSDLDDLNDDHSLEAYWIVESVVEPTACALKLSTLTSVCSIHSPNADERRLSCFELLTPVETIVFSAVRVREGIKHSERSFGDSGAFLETSATETALSKKLCSSHEQSNLLGTPGSDLSWKHQIIQGTLHAVVVSGNHKLLEMSLQLAMMRAQADADGFADISKLSPRIIDEQDESGLTPLYYAVTRKMNQAVALLVKAGASTDFRDATSGETLVHISARLHDDKSLSILLASELPRPNPNALDAMGRTPMHLACLDGNDDSLCLERCLMSLEAWGGKVLIQDSLVPVQSPLARIASLWQADRLSVVLRHVPFRLPFQLDDSLRDSTLSLGALYEYPVHSAVAAFNSILPKTDDTTQADSHLIRTLRVLIDHGFETNERMDRLPTVDTEFVGFTPLQILAILSLRLKGNIDTQQRKAHLLSHNHGRDVALFLVSNGARIMMEAPISRRPILMASPSTDQLSAVDNDEHVSTIAWTSKNDLYHALGVDDEAVKQAWAWWKDLQSAPACPTLNLLDNDALDFPNINGIGGNNEKSCAVCWKQFGAFLNRKHKCRVTRRFVCDECSTKRVIRGEKHYRVSDGQYMLARADASFIDRHPPTKIQSHSADQVESTAKGYPANNQFKRREADDQTNRNVLFGGVLSQAAELIFGEDAAQDRSSASLSGLAASLGETREALNQRGDKLSQLGDKSADLVDASESFAKMAKELAKQSERGIFW
ncbi:hypothetical protein MPSEU_000829300 [Mayamaea pseudoterrestris]|nr:hypothetical protein MPSEU_000829300 [Mayamaea pseudoterrestris]